MDKTVSNRGIRRLYWAVSACFLVLAAWLYCKEGPYVKIMDISAVPKSGQIQAEVLADGKNIKVSCKDRDVKLFVNESSEGDKTCLMIYGECEESREGSVTIKVVSDSDDWKETWNCRMLAGILTGEAKVHAAENRARKAYLWFSGLMFLFFGVRWFWGEKSKIQKELEAYSSRVIEKLGQEPGMDKFCRDGRRLCAAYEKQKVIMVLLVSWAWAFWLFWVLHGANHGRFDQVSGGCLRALIFGAAAAGCLKFAASIRWGGLSKEILTGDCRPVTAAAAYLLMGTYGIERNWSRFLLYHNGASGLYRSGHCREALEISDMAWKMLKRKPRDYIGYVHSSLKYQCFQVLEELEAAEQEKQRMEALVAQNPGWKRKKSIQRFLGIQDICQRIEAGEIEQAEKSAREILGQWKEGYYRLPVLGLMAELKEFLGKEEEAAGLREEILAFSPENKEVRQVMGEGRLRYREKKAKAWDPGLLVIDAVCLCGIAGTLFLM